MGWLKVKGEEEGQIPSLWQGVLNLVLNLRNQEDENDYLRHDRKQAFNGNIYIFFIFIKLVIFIKFHSLHFLAVYFYFRTLVLDIDFQSQTQVIIKYSRETVHFNQKQVDKTVLEGNYPFNSPLLYLDGISFWTSQAEIISGLSPSYVCTKEEKLIKI